MTRGDQSGAPAVPSAAACRSLPDVSDRPVVSVVVPTRNSGRHLAEYLRSIRAQTYPDLELIVVDNHSVDGTLQIAHRDADLVSTAGPERSAQVNAGVRVATGTYVFRVDGDFLLEPEVVAECVEHMRRGACAVVVHNTADHTVGRLARVRKFEVDMYKYSLGHTAARFLSRDLFHAVGGLRDDVTAGEDYDFQNRLRRAGVRIAFANAEAVHLDEPTQLMSVRRKYFRYGRDFPNYRRYNRAEFRQQLAFVWMDYLRHWRRFLAHSALGAMFMAYHCAKFAAGAVGYASVLGARRPLAPATVSGNDNKSA